MNKMMQKLILSCKKATELIDKKNHAGISRDEKVKLYFHTMMCSACTNYAKQSVLIDRALKDSPLQTKESQHDHSATPEGLTERIINKLNEN